MEDSLKNLKLCNISETFQLLGEMTYKTFSQPTIDISEETGCLPNCVNYKYEMTKILPWSAQISGQSGCKSNI